MATSTSPESRGPHLVENPAASKNLTHKKWYGVALAIGILVVIGVAGFGITGLLQANGVTLPPALHWLSIATQYVGNAAPVNGCLWIMAVDGAVIGGLIMTVSARAIHRLNQNRLDFSLKSLREPEQIIQLPPSVARGVNLDRAQEVEIKGTVYIEDLSSGPICNDHEFGFSQRLKDREGNPIVIEKEDIYLPLRGEISEVGMLSSSPFYFLPQDGVKPARTYLPASLFNGVKEGETVRFIWDDKLVELTCQQNMHPDPQFRSSFVEILRQTREWNCNCMNQIPCLFRNDLSREPVKRAPVKKVVERKISIDDWLEPVPPVIQDHPPRFMGILPGQKHVKLNKIDENGIPVEIPDFSVYEKDQKVNGEYQKLDIVEIEDNSIMFDLHKSRVQLSEIDLIESTGIGGVRQIWVLILHQPEKNRLDIPIMGIENGEPVYTGITHTVTPDQLIEQVHHTHYGHFGASRVTTEIKKGHIKRVCTYHYGKYFMCKGKPNREFSLEFGDHGYLVLKWK